jgi:hypothetical protein
MWIFAGSHDADPVLGMNLNESFLQKKSSQTIRNEGELFG